MALSQIQCLDNNNVNWRSSETKPEFFYSEEQRLALEALVSSGPDAFYEVIKKEKIRDFLSDLEVGKVLGSLEPFDPDSGHSRSGCDKCALGGDGDKDDECGGGSGGGAEHSLEYWPDKSDCVIPELDLGWPGTVAYRGVTRATVYMQPPIDGQPHIKEVIRKMITQAQKVIAVVMDLFTDVDILKDMLDAGFKRKVSVYIILNESDVKYFLQMCERAQMHKGHLKNLRIRSIGGSEFYTRFSTKFKGCLSQKFMFVDGDKAACGSYSFTWSAARIDRNLLTVLSGQVVESFDHQFQELYLLSKAVSLKNVPMENEPEPEPMIQPAPLPAGPPQSIAKKLINPKYALVSVKSASEREVKQAKAKLLEQKVEEPQIHPALLNMERANMFNYLPTWVEPEPEPGSDILGYINIIDPKVKNPMHSQMNRIKICDTANATAQFLMQTKKQEARHAENEEAGHRERTTARQGSREEGSATSSTKVVSPSSSFDEDLETPSLKDHKAVGQPGGHNVQQSREGFASPAETRSLGSGDQGQAPVTRSGPPVPKPRTLPVTDFISMKNALNAKSVTANTSKVENTIPSVNGGDAEGREEEDIEDLLIQTVPGGNDEGDTDRLGMYPSECLSSGSGSLPPSNASSTSEEYYPTKPLQRRSSDRIPNGEHIALQRKLSDGHISRGTFAGPLGGISQSLMDMRQVENGKRRNQTLEEELKRVLSKGEPNKDRTHAMEPTKVCISVTDCDARSDQSEP
ncbi:protein FAM83G [Spea bombifrons]|uniref:protein FAM83G n=1 Tax=Spea bombifrons TaxID=233779 RepID=UPI00234B13B3|nr:protein FAM83G [Spea bombifrons]